LVSWGAGLDWKTKRSPSVRGWAGGPPRPYLWPGPGPGPNPMQWCECPPSPHGRAPWPPPSMAPTFAPNICMLHPGPLRGLVNSILVSVFSVNFHLSSVWHQWNKKCRTFVQILDEIIIIWWKFAQMDEKLSNWMENLVIIKWVFF
jgi:hypothetical protein